MKLVVVGTGYVGLVTGACLADVGHDVVCVDSDKAKIEALKQGVMPIFEPGLEDIVNMNAAAGRLTFSADLKVAARDAEAVFIAVGTPSRACDGHADLSAVFGVARDMAPVLPAGATVVVKSTVPVGTADEVEPILNASRTIGRIAVVSNPEFLRAGSAVRDFMEPDRIVVGIEDDRSRRVMERVYRAFRRRTIPLVFTARRSSELIKYGANALLATKIAFINEMADLCERSGADIQEVANGIGLDNRIGSKFLQAGPGFGGSCFRKDALALIKMGEDYEIAMRIADAVVNSNDSRKRRLLRKVKAAIGHSLRNRIVAVWGVTFKANTDDVREAPAISLITALLDAGALVQVYDPEGLDAVKLLWPGRVIAASDPAAAVRDAEVLVIMTEWEEFKRADLTRLRGLMARPVVLDMRHLFADETMRRNGFVYHRVGKAPHLPLSTMNGQDLTIAAVPDARAENSLQAAITT